MEHSVIAIEEARENYSRLEENANEEQVQNHVVVPFITKLGYLHQWFHYQQRKVKGKIIFDIDIYPPHFPAKRIIIEIKRKGMKITDKELLQISGYVNSQNGVEFAFITNGEDYFMLNNSIQGELEQRIMLKCNILEETNKENLILFMYKSIFENGITRYFKDLAQYKVFFLEEKKQSSWDAYYATLRNFFTFMSSSNVYFPLNKIRIEDFQAFLDSKCKTKKSIETLINNYSHINALYESYKINGLLKENPFEYKVKELNTKKNKGRIEPLNDDEIDMIFQALEKTYFPERNILFFYLLLYTGMSRNSIQNLEMESIDLKNNRLLINQNKFMPINDDLRKKIELYFKWFKGKGLHSEYLLPSNYGKCKLKTLSSGNFNSIMNSCLKKTNISLERQKQITLKFVRESCSGQAFL